MPQFSDPNQPNPSASSNMEEKPFEVVLEAGLDAIDKKNYPEAIAKLETVHQKAKRRSLQLRAQMGLVKAYEGHGEYQQAFIRCKELLKSSSEPTRQWAEEAMTVLKQRYKQLPKSLNHLQNDPKSPIPDLEANKFKTDAVKDHDRRSPFRTDASTILDTPSADIFEEKTQPTRTERSPFLTEASTLVDPLAMETSTLSEPTEASTLLDPLALDRSESPSSFSDVDFFEEELEEDFFEEEQGGEELFEESLPEEDFFEDPLSEELSEETQSQDYPLQDYPLQDYPPQEERVDTLASSSEPSDPTGFVPIDTGADLSMADSGMAGSGMDSTGFVPLSPSRVPHQTSEPPELHSHFSDGSPDPYSAEPYSPESANQDDSTSAVLSEEANESNAWDLEDNPFALDLDGLKDSPDDVNLADRVSFDPEAFDTSESQPESSQPESTFASTPSDSFSKPSSETKTAASASARSPAPAVDPELAAALNVTMPRLRKRKVTQHAPADSPVPHTPERARNWKPLKPIRQVEFWLSYIWTAIALVLLFTGLTRIALDTAKPVWRFLQRFMTPPRWFFLENHTLWTILMVLVLGLVVSQWVLNIILGRCYGVKPLPERELERRSPETMRLLKRTCKQHKFPVPRLKIVSSQAPFVMSYGLLPRTSYIAVSQGLLTQLNDAEIAALYAGELGHIQHRTTVLLMLLTTITQVPFLIYRYAASWGDRQQNALLRSLAVGISSIAYGLFWLFRWPGLWLSRTRQVQGDRYAVNLTGNPNGRAIALTIITTGMAQAIERERSTEFMLAGLEMLMPVSPLQALTIGSLAIHLSSNAMGGESNAVPNSRLASLLTWGARNPHRRWLLINNTHPSLGDRIQALNRDAESLRLRPSIVIPSSASSDTAVKKQPFWLQASPYIGGPIGLSLAIALWIVGGIADIANADQLEWLWRDMSLLYGCIAIGFSFGTLMRVNAFFPDISPSQSQSDSSLPSLVQDIQIIPLNSIPVTFEGRLLGRPGVSNGLGQDLLLKTAEGTVKLHWISPIGPLGNLIIGKVRPASLIGRSVSVTGWFRRGATVWIDVEKIRADGRTLVYSSHPLWSTLVAIAATLWGAFVIYQGSL